MKFEIGELAILNQHALKGLPDRVGEIVEVIAKTNSPNYDFAVELDNGDLVPVKEKELNSLTMPELDLTTYIRRGNKVLYAPMNEEVEIVKCDYLHGQAEVKFYDSAMSIIGFEQLRPIEEKEEETVEVDKYQEVINGHTKEYWLDLFFGHYDNGDETYTVPKDLLHNLLDKLI